MTSMGLCKDCNRCKPFRSPTLFDPDGGEVRYRCSWSNSEIDRMAAKCSHFVESRT